MKGRRHELSPCSLSFKRTSARNSHQWTGLPQWMHRPQRYMIEPLCFPWHFKPGAHSAQRMLCRASWSFLFREYPSRTDVPLQCVFPLQTNCHPGTRASWAPSRSNSERNFALVELQCPGGLAIGSVCRNIRSEYSDDMHISNGIQVSFPKVSSEAFTPALTGTNLPWKGIRGMQCGPSWPGGRRRPTVAGAMRETKSSWGQSQGILLSSRV